MWLVTTSHRAPGGSVPENDGGLRHGRRPPAQTGVRRRCERAGADAGRADHAADVDHRLAARAERSDARRALDRRVRVVALAHHPRAAGRGDARTGATSRHVRSGRRVLVLGHDVACLPTSAPDAAGGARRLRRARDLRDSGGLLSRRRLHAGGDGRVRHAVLLLARRLHAQRLGDVHHARARLRRHRGAVRARRRRRASVGVRARSAEADRDDRAHRGRRSVSRAHVLARPTQPPRDAGGDDSPRERAAAHPPGRGVAERGSRRFRSPDRRAEAGTDERTGDRAVPGRGGDRTRRDGRSVSRTASRERPRLRGEAPAPSHRLAPGPRRALLPRGAGHKRARFAAHRPGDGQRRARGRIAVACHGSLEGAPARRHPAQPAALLVGRHRRVRDPGRSRPRRRAPRGHRPPRPEAPEPDSCRKTSPGGAG